MESSLEIEFVQLLQANQRIVHKVCKIYTSAVEEHEDLFQEIVIQLWNSYPKFRVDAKFSTWMYRISLNTAISLYRKKSRSITTLPEINVQNLKIETEEYQSEEEKLEEMYAAIHRLTDIEKALIMMYLDDKPFKEIGEILGITEGNARVKMNRAKKHLRTFINKK